MLTRILIRIQNLFICSCTWTSIHWFQPTTDWWLDCFGLMMSMLKTHGATNHVQISLLWTSGRTSFGVCIFQASILQNNEADNAWWIGGSIQTCQEFAKQVVEIGEKSLLETQKQFNDTSRKFISSSFDLLVWSLEKVKTYFSNWW